jgi:hypothetical protein
VGFDAGCRCAAAQRGVALLGMVPLSNQESNGLVDGGQLIEPGQS